MPVEPPPMFVRRREGLKDSPPLCVVYEVYFQLNVSTPIIESSSVTMKFRANISLSSSWQI